MDEPEPAPLPSPPTDGLERRMVLAQLQRTMFGAALGEPDPVRLGRYELDRVVGSGAMGVVYLARDPHLDRRVALKVLHPQRCLLESDRGHRQLRREGRALGRVVHDNVVAVYDVGEADGRIYVAMEWVPGRSLQHWLDEGPHPWPEVRDAFVQAGRGLSAAHQAGIAHRDFKPSNVQLGDDGRVRVLDFGLATVDRLAQTSRPSRTSSAAGNVDSMASAGTDARVAGTPHYMAPELRDGQPADARSDQYAFCVALEDALSSVEGAVPVGVRRAVQRGRSVDPRARHRTMAALLDALQRLQSRRRAPLWVGALLAVGVLAAALPSPPSSAPSGEAEVPAASEPMSPPMIAALDDLEDLIERHEYATVEARARELEDSPWMEHALFRCELRLHLATALGNRGDTPQAKALVAAVYDEAVAADLTSSRVGSALLSAQLELTPPIDPDAAARWVAAARSVGPALEAFPEQAFRLRKLDVEIAALNNDPAVLDEARGLVGFAAERWGPESHNVAVALVTQGRQQFRHEQLDEAHASATRALELERAQRSPDVMRLASAESLRADANLMKSGLMPEHAPRLRRDALAMSRHAEALYASQSGHDSPWTLEQRISSATILVTIERLDQARAEVEDILRRLETVEHKGVQEGPALELLGRIQREQGQLDEANATLQRVVLLYETRYGAEHPALLSPLYHLGKAQRFAGQLELARRTHTRLLALSPPAGPGAHASALEALARVETNAGNNAEAERWYRQSAERWAEAAGEDSQPVRNVLEAIEALAAGDEATERAPTGEPT